MKATVLLALAALVPGTLLMQTTGSSTVAVIDFDRVVSETPAGKDAITKLKALAVEQKAAIDKKQKDAEDLQNKLRLQEKVLTEAARTQLARQIGAAQTEIQTMGDNAQQKLAQMQQELLGPVERKTATAVETYAAEHSLKVVFDSSALQGGLVYVHDTADITTEIIRRIATNMQKPAQLDASAKPAERLLKRTWGDFNFAMAPRVAAEESPADRRQ